MSNELKLDRTIALMANHILVWKGGGEFGDWGQ